MGVKTGLWPQQGVQKMVFPLCGGVLAHDKVTKPILDPEDGQSALKSEHFLNLREKLA